MREDLGKVRTRITPNTDSFYTVYIKKTYNEKEKQRFVFYMHTILTTDGLKRGDHGFF